MRLQIEGMNMYKELILQKDNRIAELKRQLERQKNIDLLGN